MTGQKRKTLSKKTRELVYKKYSGHCAYCGCELEYKDMQVDHVESIARNTDYARFSNREEKTLDELNKLDNLMPSCRMCNYYKGMGNIEDLRNDISEYLIRNMRKPFDYRLALRYGLIKETIHPITFYFEKVDGIYR